MLRRLLQPNLIRRAVAIAIGGGRYASTGFSRASGGRWTPLNLFKNGEKGAWYDPSDLSTMWQDSAGTTPVTADGQPVGKILDKSGNGNHASQPVAGKRPTYRASAGTHWLDFDGVDDSLYTASINLTSASKISVFAGTANQKTLSTGTLLEFSANYLNNVGGFAMLTPSLSTSHISFGSCGTLGAGEKETQEGPAGLLRPRVLTAAQDFATANDYGCDYIRFNQISVGNLVGAGNSAVGAGPLGTFPAYIGARNNGSNAASGNSLWGRVYSLIFVGEMYDEATLVRAEEWIDVKLTGYAYPAIWSRHYNVDPSLGADATFTRAGTAYVKDNQGVYWLAAVNWPRFEGARITDPSSNGQLVYSVVDAGGAPINPATMYLLKEPAATNIVVRSKFDADANSDGLCDSWTKISFVTPSIVDQVAVTGVSGVKAQRVSCTFTGSEANYAASVNQAAPNDSLIVTAPTTITLSFFARGDFSGYTSNKSYINFWGVLFFDNAGTPQTGEIKETVATILSKGLSQSGWKRFSYTTTLTNTAIRKFSLRFVQVQDTNKPVSGDTCWVEVVLPQLEINISETSIVPTSATAVTRAADALAYSGIPANNITRYTGNTGTQNTVTDWTGAVADGKILAIEVFRA